MSREDLLEHVVTKMRSADTIDDNRRTSQTILCQNCGIQIVHEAQSKTTELDDYVIHRVPEHGEDGMSSVVYCGPDCFQASMEQLFDY